MVERLFFDWVNSKSAGTPITGHDNLVIQVLSDKTQALLAFM
jgi:hypothetical protein